MSPRARDPRLREKVLRFVRDRLASGLPPTIREVQRAAGYKAVESARQLLSSLADEGAIEHRAGLARGLRLPGSEASVSVPILGRVPAGPLHEAIEEVEGRVSIPFRRDAADCFALRVSGDSMEGAGILSGDLVIVKRQASARDGEIVVALVDGEATVKRLRLRRGRIELHPENPKHAVILPGAREVRLAGRVIELRRTLER